MTNPLKCNTKTNFTHSILPKKRPALAYYSSYFELFLPAAIIVLARTVASELLSKTVKSSCKLFSQNFSDTNINFARLSVAEARNC